MSTSEETGRTFAERNAALLADLADHRRLGLAVDDATIARLAAAHGVPPPALDPFDARIRKEQNEIDRLTVETALIRARALAEHERLERERAAALDPFDAATRQQRNEIDRLNIAAALIRARAEHTQLAERERVAETARNASARADAVAFLNAPSSRGIPDSVIIALAKKHDIGVPVRDAAGTWRFKDGPPT